jgi:hypothetical protein
VTDTRSKLDAAYAEVMSRPLTPDELKGFIKTEKKTKQVRPYVSVGIARHREKRGPKVELGVKGTF